MSIEKKILNRSSFFKYHPSGALRSLLKLMYDKDENCIMQYHIAWTKGWLGRD